jgi:hypothetical protein
MTIMRLFVVQVIVSTTHGDTQYSVNKRTNNILNHTPSGHRNFQLILAAHRRCFFEENKFSFLLCFLLTIILAEQFILHKKCPQKVYTKCVHKKCPQKVSTKSPHNKCSHKVTTKRVHNKCKKNSTKSVLKIVPKKWPQNVSTKSVHKKFPQKCGGWGLGEGGGGRGGDVDR